GNCLLGTTPTLLRSGIPDEAFDPIEGDDREYCRELKRRNRNERTGQVDLLRLASQSWHGLGDIATDLATLDDIDDATVDGVRLKEQRYGTIVRSSAYAFGRLS